jgi:protein TonB
LVCVAALACGGVLHAGDTEPPMPVRTTPPEFPKEMRSARTSGIVVISCEVDDRGLVNDAKVAKTTNEAFDKAALEAVAKWKFRPAQKDGKAVTMRINVPVKFTYEE